MATPRPLESSQLTGRQKGTMEVTKGRVSYEIPEQVVLNLEDRDSTCYTLSWRRLLGVCLSQFSWCCPLKIESLLLPPLCTFSDICGIVVCGLLVPLGCGGWGSTCLETSLPVVRGTGSATWCVLEQR